MTIPNGQPYARKNAFDRDLVTDDDLIGLARAARMGLSRFRAYGLIRSGVLPFSKAGRAYLVRAGDVRDLLRPRLHSAAQSTGQDSPLLGPSSTVGKT